VVAGVANERLMDGEGALERFLADDRLDVAVAAEPKVGLSAGGSPTTLRAAPSRERSSDAVLDTKRLAAMGAADPHPGVRRSGG
jgi:hypothetical protein